MTADEAIRQSRRDRVIARGKCVKCCQRAGRHSVNGARLCCECYVSAGHEPAEFHPECMAAAAALKDVMARRAAGNLAGAGVGL
jgi:hypothetical protein